MSGNRIEQFKSEVAEAEVAAVRGERDQVFVVLGVLLMVVGIVLSVAGYFSSTNQSDPRDQNELIILALTGVAMAVTGAAVFLRYSLGRFLRFFLMRQLYEGQAHLDTVVDAIRQRESV